MSIDPKLIPSEVNGALQPALLSVLNAWPGIRIGTTEIVLPLAVAAPAPVLPPAPAPATGKKTIYVSSTGSDSNAGTQESPLKTITKALTFMLGGGDTIYVLPGAYAERVQVTRGGDATGNLIIKGQGAKVRGFNIQKNYVTIDGFEVTDPGSNNHGIEATYLDGNTALNGPHHLTAINNTVHDVVGGGIVFAYGDWYTISNNTVYNTCATNTYQPSGISVYEPRPVDSVASELRVIISGNKSYNNQFTVSGVTHSDGNGIIIDDFRHTQQPTKGKPYPHKTLVERNQCWGNGGKGIHVFYSDNVLVQFNTCYGNNRDNINTATWRGELNNAFGNNNVWQNNIGYAVPSINKSNSAILEGNSTGVVWRNNLTFNGTVGAASVNGISPPAGNQLGVDPKFASLTAPDFHSSVAGVGAYA